MRLRAETSEAPVHGLDSDPFDRVAMGRASMKRRILLVDDEPLCCEHLCKILEADGFEVEAVGEGGAALEAARRGCST